MLGDILGHLVVTADLPQGSGVDQRQIQLHHLAKSRLAALSRVSPQQHHIIRHKEKLSSNYTRRSPNPTAPDAIIPVATISAPLNRERAGADQIQTGWIDLRISAFCD